ncbi:MAG: OmpH family outer membrane protein [Thermodesulfobacteriota bacterium]
MRVMKWFFPLVLIVVLFSVPALAKDKNIKIGYINLQKALNESEAGVAAKDYLQTEMTEKEKELNVEQESLKALKDEMDEKQAIWNDETRKAKALVFNQQSKALQEKFMKFGEELNKKTKQSEAQIIEDLSKIVEKIAKKEGFTYVFERSVAGLLVAPDGNNLTQDVIDAYDKKYREENK